MAELRESEVIVDGVRSLLLESGPADAAEAVVFVHGNPGSAYDWAALLAGVGEFARGIALDLPGFGRADKPADFNYSIEGYLVHLTDAWKQLGVERAHVVVHDFGGPFGLLWAAMNPEKFASAVVIDTGVLPGYRWHYLARIWRRRGLGELFQAAATRWAFRLLLRHGNPRGLPREFTDRMFDDYDRGTRRAVLRLYRATDDPGGQTRILSAALAPHDRPALVIWGAHDPYIPAGYAEQQRQAFPSADVQVFEDSGHWPFIDNPERTAELVLPFLRAQQAAAEQSRT